MADTTGVDLDSIASDQGLAFAAGKLGHPPTFWGRYFKGPGNRSRTQYQVELESDFFAEKQIKVLPLGRQTAHVNKADRDLGYEDGLRNAAALLASFGAVNLSKMDEIVVFLDAEIDNPLHHLYYAGWCDGLRDGGSKTLIDFSDEIKAHQVPTGTKVNFLPCLYAHHNDDHTWSELGVALGQGAICGAAWIVFMDLNATFPIGPWRPNFTAATMPAGLRVAIAQRILDLDDGAGHTFDFNLVNPTHKEWLLPRLILPHALVIS